MSSKIVELALGLTTLLSGFYGGVGFFTYMGGNPTISGLSVRGFAEYWQNIDRYMGARMPVFGISLLVSLLFSVIILSQDWRSPSFWLMLIALLIIIVDIAFTLSTNHPLNKMIQEWNLDSLPPGVEFVKDKVVNAFKVRSSFMIGSFVLVLLAVWLRKH
jgi:uncharacterized membrane protein YoaK (UPF0700 family)